ncbi:TNF receptor-associated factor 4-like [Dysidea avara]|uniref:TNF receptor-associated factor 4-like n=1 Tax=Dysidea avara TaxID=196820 RepID=UPI0033243760
MAIATPGGYENKFVDVPLDSLVCRLCIHPCRDPYLSGCCGHNFCKSCLDNARRVATNCPLCRNKEFAIFPNKLSGREIMGLHVMCTNKERGCEWQGELNHINNHLGNSDGCQFEDVKCSNECGKMLQRQYLTSHVETECPCRKVDCQYCHITGEHQVIEGEHKEQCPKIPLPCPNKCEVGSVPHEDMETHRKECPLEMVQCEYHNVGCEEKMMRKDLVIHNSKKAHDHLAMTKNQLEDLQNRCAKLEAVISSSDMDDVISSTLKQWGFQLIFMITSNSLQMPVTIKMSEYINLKKAKTTWYSNPFRTCDKGYKMCLYVTPAGSGDGKDTHLSMYLYLMKGPYDDELTWPLRGKFEVKLLNQISDCEHYLVTLVYDDKCKDDIAGRVIDGDRPRGWGHHKFISNEDLHMVTHTCQYLKDDCIFFQVRKR